MKRISIWGGGIENPINIKDLFEPRLTFSGAITTGKGWYKIAKINSFIYSGTINIASYYNTSTPSSSEIFVQTAYRNQKIVNLSTVCSRDKNNAVVPPVITGIRITTEQSASEDYNNEFYIEIYYNRNTSNNIFVSMDNFPNLTKIKMNKQTNNSVTVKAFIDLAEN